MTFKEWCLKQYGVERITEAFNQRATLMLTIAATSEHYFLKKFKHPADKVYNPISNADCYQVDSAILEEFYRQYETENKENNITNLQSALANFKQMKQQIVANGLSSYIDKAHILSLDYTNPGHANSTIFEASAAYGMSLRIFAELHRNDLSKEQYLALKHATEMLASYDETNTLRQGLKSDSNFMDYLIFTLGKNRGGMDGSLQLISNSPNYSMIRKTIDENVYNVLHGKQDVSLEKNKAFNMRRFLPDAAMDSETNEIVLQTGGMINHSAMARIIKVGMLNNGQCAHPNDKADYFNYFKVESNLGAGCHGADWTDKTCMGTYVTQLLPTYKDVNGKLNLSDVNPVLNPHQYQNEMENTLTELITAEREISFYRQPQNGPNGEPVDSAEAAEWLRLNNRLTLLNGNPVSGKVHFISIQVDGTEIPTWVHNQKGYMQEGGSYPIFSIKQLVTSIVGQELTSLHSLFLQKNDGKKHLQTVNGAIKKLTDSILNQLTDYAKISLTVKKMLQNNLDKLSPEVISDLNIIGEFYTDQLQRARNKQNDFDEPFKTSIKEFYKEAVAIRLSNHPLKDQAKQLKEMAHTKFTHRHYVPRLLADILVMISTLFVAGVVRVLTGHSFFWSTAKTEREKAIGRRLVHPDEQTNTLMS